MPSEGYAIDWTAIALAGAIGFAAMAGMFAASTVLAPRKPSATKAIPYESGIRPSPLNPSQFNVRYYIFGILFLIFDVEAVFLFPWAIVFLDAASFVFYAMMIFIVILLFGVLYAWRKGVLQWR